jgi:ubiquinone/menaquinone biosynthesis C-methylase UbiE
VTQPLPFDRIADSYDETRGGEDRGRRFAGELHRSLRPDRPVLEVGVGTGVVALGLSELGYRVFGIDLSMPMLRRAHSRVGPRVALADARRLPFADGSFDQVYSVWVLHVAGDPVGVLHEVARVLRPGGRYLVVPAMGERPDDPIGAIVWDMQRALDPFGVRRDEDRRLAGYAPEAGLSLVDTQVWPGFEEEESPAEAMHKIESRSFSMLWNRSDEEWEHAVVPAIEALRRLPDPDRPMKRTATNRMVILERPAVGSWGA